MRFSTTFIPLLAAGSSLAAATRSSLTRGAAASRRDIIQSRQMHIQRDLLDVCASLDVDLEILGIVYGHLDICLCVSLIPDFIEVDVVAQVAVDVLGLAAVEASIQALIEGADSHEQCQYPPHAEPVCEVGWVCGFKCEDGFTPYTPPGSDHPTECVCDLPSTVCNGICGSFPNGCGSQSASRRKRAPTCASGLTACGVPGGSRGKGYECLDTTSELESCGGCVVSSPFSTPVNARVGRDCSAIPHVSSVLCAQSKCVVSACNTGYTVSSSGDSCVASSSRKRDLLDAGAVAAAAADVANLVEADAIGAAGVSVLRRDVLDAGAIAAAAADVANLVEADAIGAAGVSVLRRDVLDAGAVAAVAADVANLVEADALAAAGVSVLRRDILDAGAIAAVAADVANLVEADAIGAAGVEVLRRDVLDAGAVAAAAADVANLVKADAIGAAGVKVLRRDVLDAGAIAAVAADVANLVEADAIGAAGVSVLRRDILDAGAIAAVAADVANIVEADAIGAAGVSVLRRDVLDAGAVAAVAADVANLVEADALAAAGVSVL